MQGRPWNVRRTGTRAAAAVRFGAFRASPRAGGRWRACQNRPVSRKPGGDFVWLAIGFVVLLWATRGYYLGDTNTYVIEIARNFGRAPFGAAGGLWEFGHLLWRPFGWLLLEASAPFARASEGGLAAVCAFALIAVNAIAGLVTVLLWFAMARELVASRVVALSIAAAFACGNAFLTYVHSGSSYVPGLLSVTLAIWIARRPGGRVRLWVSAALVALAALLWFPYVLSFPGVLLLHGRDGIGRVARFTAVFAAFLIAGFAAGALAGGIRTPAEARAWVADSSHGWSQSQRVLRLATGLPRTLLYLGKDGVLYRRYLRKDPYAPTPISALVRASLWKLAAFYLFAACLLYALLKAPARPQLALLAAGALPVLAFAVLLFEPGSAERYFPAWPFLLVAVAWVLRDFPAGRRVPQLAVAAFLVAMAATNVAAMWRPRIDAEDRAPAERLAEIQAAGLRPGSLVAIVTNQDAIERLSNRALFAPANRLPLRLYDVVEPGTDRVSVWREGFATEALNAWSRGGDVWVSKRFWQQRPRPEWDWVEGDDRRIAWDELPRFFGALPFDRDTGGIDGFVRLERALSEPQLRQRRFAIPHTAGR